MPIARRKCFICEKTIRALEPYSLAMADDDDGEPVDVAQHVSCFVRLLAQQVADEIRDPEAEEEERDPVDALLLQGVRAIFGGSFVHDVQSSRRGRRRG